MAHDHWLPYYSTDTHNLQPVEATTTNTVMALVCVASGVHLHDIKLFCMKNPWVISLSSSQQQIYSHTGITATSLNMQ